MGRGDSGEDSSANVALPVDSAGGGGRGVEERVRGGRGRVRGGRWRVGEGWWRSSKGGRSEERKRGEKTEGRIDVVIVRVEERT